jgi:hypothetical protein
LSNYQSLFRLRRNIVENKTFENGLVTVIDGQEDDLLIEEKLVLEPFSITQDRVPSPKQHSKILQEALQSKSQKLHTSRYVNLSMSLQLQVF